MTAAAANFSFLTTPQFQLDASIKTLPSVKDSTALVHIRLIAALFTSNSLATSLIAPLFRALFVERANKA